MYIYMAVVQHNIYVYIYIIYTYMYIYTYIYTRCATEFSVANWSLCSRVLLRNSVLLRNTILCCEWAIAQQSIYVYVHIYIYTYVACCVRQKKKVR